MDLYEFLSIIGVFIAIAISIISLAFSYILGKKANDSAEHANLTAESANTLSKEANIMALKANAISEQSNELANRANEISMEAIHSANRPIIILKSFYLDPNTVRVYGGKDIVLPGKKPILASQINAIRNTLNSNSITTFELDNNGNTDEFVLINLCRESTKDEQIGLVLNAACMEFEITGVSVNEVKLEKAYSMVASDKSFPNDLKIKDINFIISDSTLTLKLAYTWSSYDFTSLNVNSIAQLSHDSNDQNGIIDILKEKNRAREIIGYVETGYLFSCKTRNNYDYKFSLIIDCDMDNGGKLRYHHIYHDDDEFNRRALEANERANANVVVTC